MKRTGLILLISGFWLLVSGYHTNIHAQDETLEIITYYPAPYGVYQQLEVLRQDGSYSNLMISQYNDATIYPMITFRKARGTLASPTAILDNYRLGTIVFGGHDGTSFQNGAEIYAIADADWGGSERGTELRFQTRDGGGALSDRITIEADGEIRISNETLIRVDNPDSLAGPLGSASLTVQGHTSGSFGAGISAFNSAGSVYHAAIYGRNQNATEGVGIMGIGTEYGVIGIGNNNPTGSLSIVMNRAGVYGYTDSPSGAAVVGVHSDSSEYAGWFVGRIASTSERILGEHTAHPQPGHAGHVYDIAELIPCGSDVEYGDVVVINPDKDREAIKCYKELDPTIAGVISDKPQLSLGDREKAREKEPEKNWNFLALAGQVYVKADATFGEIKRGDLLTTSPTPGYAMKAKPVCEINGYPIYPQGCIVGKALEPLKEEKGKILVLVCLM